MGFVAGKVWGKTELLISHPAFEIHRIETKAGGFCSKHKHQHRYNDFYVESGTFKVKVWKNDYDLCDETVLEAGDIMTVPPGEYHQFESVTDCVVLEIYYAPTLDGADIVRESVGGNK
jgi:mannose-6-phosphate isomerase-like protein (cupin superfamily)